MNPSSEDDEETPSWNIEDPYTRIFFDSVNPDGYQQSEHSAIWPILLTADIDKGEGEMNTPYCVYGSGDKMIVECADEPSQEISPYKGVFPTYCLTPGKTYHWTTYDGAKVLKNGSFKAVGRVRWLKIPSIKYPHNMRDLGCPAKLTTTGKGIKFGRIIRAEHPDNIEVDSAEHIYLRDQLRLSVQLNLRNPKDDPARTDLFEKTYSYNIPAYAVALDNNTTYKTAFKNAFLALVKELEAGRNVFVNCWQGRDRTGTFCWVVQALCGMKAGYCEAHWELSAFDRCENSKIWDWEEASRGELRTFIGKLEKLYGEDAYTQAYRFITEKIGVAKERVEKLKEIMIG